MISFDQQLRDLVDEWRSKGMPEDEIIAVLMDEIESLNDLRSSRESK